MIMSANLVMHHFQNNLVLDFDIIEQAAETRAPKYMEWFGAMALVMTLIWLYLEILRLLAKLRN